MNSWQIIEFQDQYKDVFRALNAEWLEHYNLMESHDIEILNDPKKTILDTGGAIYLAKLDKQIIGSAALMKEHDNVYELVKMAVAKEYRKMGISRALLETCIHKAKELNASKIILFSNHQLKAALGLYEKYGFKYIPVEDSPFLTADIKMELVL